MGRHYRIENDEGCGWWLVDSVDPFIRTPLGPHFPGAMRRFREIAEPGIPAILRGAS